MANNSDARGSSSRSRQLAVPPGTSGWELRPCRTDTGPREVPECARGGGGDRGRVRGPLIKQQAPQKNEKNKEKGASGRQHTPTATSTTQG